MKSSRQAILIRDYSSLLFESVGLGKVTQLMTVYGDENRLQ